MVRLAVSFALLASLAGCSPTAVPQRRDGGARDAGTRDAGLVDAGQDAAPLDAASLDGAPFDASTFVDAGVDAAPDAGPADVGVDAPCPMGFMRCGATCIDTRSDLANCGACGRVCDLAGAVESCVAATCFVASCEAGRGDCDHVAGNGCEGSCTTGSACTTSCGSAGAQQCASVCAPTCAPPAESCNLVDDDCDGACDEDVPGCRVAVHRAYRASDTSHFYTSSLAEASSGGHVVQNESYFFLRTSGGAGLVPFHRCLLADARHFYTTSDVCEGAAGSVNEGVLGFLLGAPGCGATPLFRVAAVDHLYTISAAERDAVVAGGALDEGVVGYVWTSP